MNDNGLTIYEVRTLREARNLMDKKPEACLKYFGGHTDKKALIALILSALLERAKQQNEILKLVLAVEEFIKMEVK